MNVFQVFTQHVRTAVETLARAGAVPATLDLSRIVVEPPREASHGDLATNAAMALAKDAGLKPRELAEKIAAEILLEHLLLCGWRNYTYWGHAIERAG